MCKLSKALYSLKQGPRAWFDKLSSTFLGFGFHKTKCDSSVFYRFFFSSIVYILIYVDDILKIGSDSTEINNLIAQLHSTFTLKDLGPLHYVLGIKATTIRNDVVHLYISDLLEKIGLDTIKAMLIPMVSGLKLLSSRSSFCCNPSKYRSILGGLQYATITRPEIASAVNKVS